MPERVDVVIETVGEATWSHSLKALRPGGAIRDQRYEHAVTLARDAVVAGLSSSWSAAGWCLGRDVSAPEVLLRSLLGGRLPRRLPGRGRLLRHLVDLGVAGVLAACGLPKPAWLSFDEAACLPVGRPNRAPRPRSRRPGRGQRGAWYSSSRS
ncbi:hypothetical protein [Streptomyces sp. NBC_01483]|uniref:hypothetical protein n=1 Tax=Streptomyces sp. NBC_01483 TaxID=2903883 RepID=UPI002E373291|nr:hypothetical protein [Streptomyces sp. NBC_01483]